jgi:DNA-binding NtrC family response regulator
MGLKSPGLGRTALEALSHYPFPGNVRELKNVIERALIESGGGTIGPEHLHLRARPVAATLPNQHSEPELVASLPLNLAEAEDLLIQRALKETGGNIAEAARLLGVHRTRIYRKLAQEDCPPDE